MDTMELSKEELTRYNVEQKEWNNIRRNRHANSELCGSAFTGPIEALMDEMITFPEHFTIEERMNILSIFRETTKSAAAYKCLGVPYMVLFDKVKENIKKVSLKNGVFCKSILSKQKTANGEDFTRSLLNSLIKAQPKQDAWLNLLDHLKDKIEFGQSNCFSLYSIVSSTFRGINNNIRGGKKSIEVDVLGREFCDEQVFLPQEDFVKYVLNAIITNLDKHAFPQNWSSKKTDAIRIRFSLSDDSSLILVKIANNGVPFDGDCEEIFKEGVTCGNGDGIGLFEARKFLEKFNSSIVMDPVGDDDYKVSFTISIPIYNETN